jgi:hypothetical protein
MRTSEPGDTYIIRGREASEAAPGKGSLTAAAGRYRLMKAIGKT